MEKREEVVSTHFDAATRLFGMTVNQENFSLEEAKNTVAEVGKSKNMPYALEIVEL